MYIIKWIREISKEDHLKYITAYKDVIWRDLKEAMLFKTPEEAQEYVVKNLGGESRREETISWMNEYTKILYIHPLNIR